jgi:hypothetical protein
MHACRVLMRGMRKEIIKMCFQQDFKRRGLFPRGLRAKSRSKRVKAPGNLTVAMRPSREVFERNNVSETFFPRGLRAKSRSKREARFGSSTRARCALRENENARALRARKPKYYYFNFFYCSPVYRNLPLPPRDGRVRALRLLWINV